MLLCPERHYHTPTASIFSRRYVYTSKYVLAWSFVHNQGLAMMRQSLRLPKRRALPPSPTKIFALQNKTLVLTYRREQQTSRQPKLIPNIPGHSSLYESNKISHRYQVSGKPWQPKNKYNCSWYLVLIEYKLSLAPLKMHPRFLGKP